jgi:ribosomal-protein-alanine N-acetyltransferase
VTQQLRIGIAQVAQVGDVDQNLEKALEYIDKAAGEGVELLCFPEVHLAGYRVGIIGPEAPVEADRLAAAEEAVQERCRERGIAVCMGTETPNGDEKPFNSALIVGSDGEVVARHHKSRLTPKDELGYTAGEGPTAFELDAVPMGAVICFEGFRFPETSRELAKGGAKVILHPQFNHVLPGAEWKLPVHHALITARAAENTVYFVSANMAHERNNCRSLIVAPDGLVAAQSELRQEMLIHADADLDRATHAFLKTDPAERVRMLAEAG